MLDEIPGKGNRRMKFNMKTEETNREDISRLNSPEDDINESVEQVIEHEEFQPHKVTNQLELFWNGDGYQNNRLAIAYINMCADHAEHDCDQCKYISRQCYERRN